MRNGTNNSSDDGDIARHYEVKDKMSRLARLDVQIPNLVVVQSRDGHLVNLPEVRFVDVGIPMSFPLMMFSRVGRCFEHLVYGYMKVIIDKVVPF